MATKGAITIAEIKKLIKKQKDRVNQENLRLRSLQLWLKQKQDIKDAQKSNKIKEDLKRKVKKIK